MILLKLVMFTIKQNHRKLKLKDEMYFSNNLTKDIEKKIVKAITTIIERMKITAPLMSKYV